MAYCVIKNVPSRKTKCVTYFWFFEFPSKTRTCCWCAEDPLCHWWAKHTSWIAMSSSHPGAHIGAAIQVHFNSNRKSTQSIQRRKRLSTIGYDFSKKLFDEKYWFSGLFCACLAHGFHISRKARSFDSKHKGFFQQLFWAVIRDLVIHVMLLL